MATFRHELQRVLNMNSKENGSNTPDFILARFLIGCLNSFDVATNERTAWYDPKLRAEASCSLCKGTGSATNGASFYPCPNCSAPETEALCPHGMPLADNVCGPCSEGRANRSSVETSVQLTPACGSMNALGHPCDRAKGHSGLHDWEQP